MTTASRNHLGLHALSGSDAAPGPEHGTVRARAPQACRSPRYPAVNLETALDRALALYRQEGRNVVPHETILDHWGYARGGSGFGVLAGLKRFGLLRSEEPGKSRLSALALRIILDERAGSIEREDAVRQAALTPAIHREIWETYPEGLPSDPAIRRFLCRDRGFTGPAADKLIKEFHETVAFAKLDADPGPPRRNHDDAAGVAVVRIPLSGSEWVTLEGRFPLSEDAWDQLMRVLEAMRPGLAASGVEPSDADA